MNRKYIIISLFCYSWSTDILIPQIDSKDMIIEHQGYVLNYIEKDEQAEWVAHKLSWNDLQYNLKNKRPSFKRDKKVISGSASSKDYTHSNYDRGHLVPAADFRWSKRLYKETFLMSNVSPQKKELNRYIWKDLEKQIRDDWTRLYKELHVTTGPILNDNLTKLTNKHGTTNISIPDYFYKVIIDYKKPGYKGIGFIIPNQKSNKSFKFYAVSIDSVESATGINFFEKLPDAIENTIEKELNLKDWDWN